MSRLEVRWRNAGFEVFWKMFITGIGTATPPRAYTQRECWEALRDSKPFLQLSPRAQTLLEKVLASDHGIDSRHLSFENLSEAFNLNPDALHQRFARFAPILAAEAGRKALAAANVSPEQIDAVLVSTCTGYLCPGLSGYVSEALGLRSDILGLDLVGQGCGAALPNLQTARAFIVSKTFGRVLSICAEVCSAAFYLDNDPGVLISACLFGDGAAALVCENSPNNASRRIEWINSNSSLRTAQRESLRFEQRHGMLRNVLHKRVPILASEMAASVLAESMRQNAFSMDQIAAWIFHAGGKNVLEALISSLGLTERDLRFSAGVLRQFGNVSSPSVLFALRAALDERAPGGLWWLSSFGAGVSSHGALLRVE